MKILIGTPIHQTKDYCMERWLENVSKLLLEYPADLLLVDNSPGLEYVEKVRGYCVKHGLTNYKIKHFEFDQGMTFWERERRVEIALGIIRQEILFSNYDAWFSWECDQIMPTNALDKIIKIMNSGNFMMVAHNSWHRTIPNGLNFSMGCTLIKRECLELEKIQLLFEPSDERSFDAVDDDWLENLIREKALQSGGSYTEVQGIINPIYHLDEQI